MQVAGVHPPRFRLTRPATGRGAKTIDLQELRSRCAPDVQHAVSFLFLACLLLNAEVAVVCG